MATPAFGVKRGSSSVNYERLLQAGIAVGPAKPVIPWLIQLDKSSVAPIPDEVDLLVVYSRYLLGRRGLQRGLPARDPSFRTLVFIKGASAGPYPREGWNWKQGEWSDYDDAPSRWGALGARKGWKPWSLPQLLEYIEGTRYFRLAEWQKWLTVPG